MKIDLHVHVVGTGAGGTGCWYRPRGLTRLGEPWMLRGFGLDSRAIGGDLDGIYADRLLSLVRASSLDAVVVLAQDEPHDVSGRPIPDRGSFYVPNDYVLGSQARTRNSWRGSPSIRRGRTRWPSSSGAF